MDTRRNYKKCLHCEKEIVGKGKNAMFCANCLPTRQRIRIVFDVSTTLLQALDNYCEENNSTRSREVREAITKHISKKWFRE